MNITNPNAKITGHPNLNIFLNTPIQTSIIGNYTDEILPYQQLNSGNTYEFKIKADENEFIKFDESKLRLEFVVKLRKSDNSALALSDWEDISVVNNFFHSMWSQVDLFVRDTPTNTALQTYPYKSLYHSIVGTTKRVLDTRKEHYTMYYDDDLSSSKKDLPHEKRQKAIKPNSSGPFDKGNVVVLIDTLDIDLNTLKTAIPGGIELTLRLVLARPEFQFMIKNDRKDLIPSIDFQSIKFYAVKYLVDSETTKGIEIGLKNGALMPFRRSEVRTFILDNGLVSKNIDHVIEGQIPNAIHLGFTKNSGYSGNYNINPFYFENFKLNQLQCYINGIPVKRTPYQPNFETHNYDEEYLEFLRINGNYTKNPLTTITPSRWEYGLTFFSFDLTQDRSAGRDELDYMNIRQNGNLRISVRFGQALTETINCILICCWENYMTLDQFKNSYFDF